jgi:hypothetical protein
VEKIQSKPAATLTGDVIVVPLVPRTRAFSASTTATSTGQSPATEHTVKEQRKPNEADKRAKKKKVEPGSTYFCYLLSVIL